MDPAIHPELEDLAADVSQALVHGELTLGQVVGLTEGEIAAVVGVAEGLRRRGKLPDAAAVYGALLGFSPLRPGLWRAMAELQQQLGQPALVLACYQVLNLLQDQDLSTCQLREQARCLEQLGQPILAKEVIRTTIMSTERRSK